MELRIRDSSGFIDKEFGFWLISKIRVKLLSNISRYNLRNWDTYLTESETLTRLYKKNYKAADIIVFAANNLTCDGTDGEITIHFNSTKFTPGFDRLKLDTIIRTINYGTLDTKGCPIFTDTLDFYAKDIDTYVGLYYHL